MSGAKTNVEHGSFPVKEVQYVLVSRRLTGPMHFNLEFGPLCAMQPKGVPDSAQA